MAYYGRGSPTRRSVDGGVTWTSVAPQPALTGSTYGCRAGSATSVYVGGGNDQRLTSIDAGLTYAIAATTWRDQFGAAAWSSDRFVTVGDYGSIRRTTDGGTTITQPASGTSQDLRDVEAFASTTAVAVGAGGTILRTTDGGATWSSISSGTGSLLRAIERAPDGTLYAVGDSGVVLRSTDDGVTWTTRAAPAGAPRLNDISAFGPSGLWVASMAGVTYRSTDGGATWGGALSVGSAFDLTSIDTLDGQTAVTTILSNVSGTGVSYRTTDAGATWTPNVAPGTQYAYAVRFLNASTVVIATSGGHLRSTDGGLSYAAVAGTYAYTLAPIDENTFLVAGLSDSIGRVRPTASIPDIGGGVDFASATSSFGACLATATGTSSTSWPVAGAGNCTAGNPTLWRGISVTATGPTGKVAATPLSGTASLDLVFGAKSGPGQSPGAYVADLTFEVVAPEA
ncbi:MAG: hypothetical protein JWL76_1231 [Thermoleophilia bacterium]|nr:hypothetical protein [Thermoleophilia bacterium]